MQIRKLALLGAVALVAIGCVVAAGCTSTQTTPVSQSGDSITGIWFLNYTDDNGIHAKSTFVINDDGTGVRYVVYDDSTADIRSMTWKETSEGVYAIAYSSGESDTYKMNSAEDRIVTSVGEVVQKMRSLSGDDASLLGPWCNEKTNSVTIFNADGTGSIYMKGTVIGTFSWKSGDPGTFKVHYDTGGFAGHDAVWSYDPEKDIALGDDGMFSVTRPTKSVEGVTVS